jgi:hypothetical protein
MSIAVTKGGAVRNINPSSITGIARAEGGGPTLSDIHAAPSLVTFCELICASEEYRVLPESPPTVDHWPALGWIARTTAAASTAAAAKKRVTARLVPD